MRRKLPRIEPGGMYELTPPDPPPKDKTEFFARLKDWVCRHNDVIGLVEGLRRGALTMLAPYRARATVRSPDDPTQIIKKMQSSAIFPYALPDRAGYEAVLAKEIVRLCDNYVSMLKRGTIKNPGLLREGIRLGMLCEKLDVFQFNDAVRRDTNRLVPAAKKRAKKTEDNYREINTLVAAKAKEIRVGKVSKTTLTQARRAVSEDTEIKMWTILRAAKWEKQQNADGKKKRK